MLGDSTSVLGSSGELPPVAGAHEGGEEGGAASNSGEEDKGRGDEGERSFGGNRWPRQETLALLKIRSDMDMVFRDSSVKGPLWEDVSRKLAELGYHRSAKKCKEKFENVFKYHKRTKEGRTGKQDGKNYRFFDQLEALENHPSLPSPTPPKTQTPVAVTAAGAMSVANPLTVPQITVLSTTHPIVMSQSIVPPAINLTIPSLPPSNLTILPPQATTNPTNPSQNAIPSSSFPNMSSDLMSNSSSSSTSSDEELERRHKRKRKWKDFFERLMKEVINKQEELQKRFLEAVEKREHERVVREEAWRMQEMARINREREILVQERSIAAAKDAAVMTFLQKIAEQQNLGQILGSLTTQQPPPVAAPPPSQPAPPPTQPAHTPAPLQRTLPRLAPLQEPQSVANLDVLKVDNGENFLSPSSSRWPKVEVQALIKLRTNLDCKYQENGPKGPLWEEISAAMKKIGYNRSSKRCKEKWENINKYFKKVKESNKKRPEDSKTCPYFPLLDALYKEKNNKIDNSSSNPLKPENTMVPIMVRPEQQWPPPPEQEHRPDTVMENIESEQMDQNQEDDDDDDDDDEDDDEGGNYEIVANKPSSMGAIE